MSSFDDDQDLTAHRPPMGLGGILSWVLFLATVGGCLIWAQKLYDVAYGYIPGDFLGKAHNQLGTEEIIVNEPSVQIYSQPDKNSPIRMPAPQNGRLTVDGREGAFWRVVLGPSDVGYLPLRSGSPGYLLLPNSEQGDYARKFFPEHYIEIEQSIWQEQPGQRSNLALVISNRGSQPIQGLTVAILLQDEVGQLKDTRTLDLKVDLPPGESRSVEDLTIDLKGGPYPRSEIDIVAAKVGAAAPPTP